MYICDHISRNYSQNEDCSRQSFYRKWKKKNTFYVQIFFPRNSYLLYCASGQPQVTIWRVRNASGQPQVTIWRVRNASGQPQVTIWRVRNASGQATGDNMARAQCITNTKGYTHILTTCNTYCFSTITIVARTRPNVTSYVHCSLSCVLCILFPFLDTLIALQLTPNVWYYMTCL